MILSISAIASAGILKPAAFMLFSSWLGLEATSMNGREKSVTVADLTGVGVKAGIPRTRCIAIANEMQDRIRDAGFAVRD